MMKASSVSNIRKELYTLHPDRLIELVMRLAKYKVENKELLSYLLFHEHKRDEFLGSVKKEIDDQFKNLNKSRVFLAKKTVRKALKTTQKYIKFAADKTIEIELLIYYCRKLKTSGLVLRYGTVLGNIYMRQTERISKVFDSLHDDLKLDYVDEIERIL